MRTSRVLLLSQRSNRTTVILFAVSVVSALFSFVGKAQAEAACESIVAQIVSIQGIVELRRIGQTIWQQVDRDMTLCPGDTLHVRARSRAALRLFNDSMLRLDQKTTITFSKMQDEAATSLLDLFTGALHILTRTPKPFKITTPFVNAGVEGTEFNVSVDQDSTRLDIYEGQVSASNELGTLELIDGEAAIVRRNEAPQKIAMVSSTDAVQWALYYPTIINYQLDEKLTAEPAWLELQASIALYQQDKFFEALSKLDEVPQSTRTTHFQTYYAGLLLSVGRVDEATAAIEQALVLDPDNSNAYALKAIVAVVQNDKQQALALATHAVELESLSSTTKLALSYAQQAHFEIEEALVSVQKAVKIDTQNALAWARLAELQMSLGYLDRALDAARQAVNLNPTLAKTQTVLGFAHLLQIDTESAKTIFSQAIDLDQADPMPRMGLGLALIRESDLEAGRIELEIAVSLDPANSLIRSYLGKAYFEEKRYPLASTQFDIAKQRDPHDPTPWFYDAIQKQTQNRLVEALQDIQKSIELNDNRAVYRSKLLLDQDQAGRGSSLARIYDNLGFQKRALMETAKSLSYDPSNHSAHRFLSDAYRNIPRHEIARVSELLQAQLLQPINVNPVQPHLAVADLNIITNTGPAVAGFNEFTPLMERNKPQLVASGSVGSNSTIGDEVVASMLYDRASISMGQYHFQSDGFRPNNDQNHNIYNAFMQYMVTPKFNVQAEVRRRETEHGDLFLYFRPDSFSRDQQRKLDENIARVGSKYAISPKQDFLFSAIYIDRNEKNSPSTSIDTLLDKGFLIEAQHLFRETYFNSTLGGSVYRFDAESKGNDFNRAWEHTYLYTNINYIKDLNATIGLSYDSYRQTNNNLDFDKVNPKFGLQWNFTHFLRLRLAWLKVSKPSLIANQTLEPTQVAGFNQFFDDPNGTRAEHQGIGLDGNLSKTLFSGVEFFERDLNVPIFVITNLEKEKQKEQHYRAYVYWLPHPRWSFRSEFQFEKFTRKPTESTAQFFTIFPTRIRTMSVPLSVNYYSQTGWFAGLTGTYMRQELSRANNQNEGADNFFLLDALLGYRLPHRRGILTINGGNLLNEKFSFRNTNFFQSESFSPFFIPSRNILAKFTLNF